MYIKMNEDKTLVITVPTTIYRGEKNADLITFLVPGVYEDKNVADCKMLMRYILPSGVGRSEMLRFQPEMHKSYLQYSTTVNTRLTEGCGDVIVWLTAFDENDNIVLKTGEVVVTVYQSKDITAYLPADDLDQIDQLAEKVAYLDAKKADNISFDEATGAIQLMSNGMMIGDQIVLEYDSANCIVGVEQNADGELVAIFKDGTTKNLGHINSEVYIPHLDKKKILSWTIEKATGDVPDPVDLNPFDEWQGIDGADGKTDYLWESM